MSIRGDSSVASGDLDIGDDELPFGSLEALVSVRVEDGEQFVRLARWWLMESRSRLCGSLWSLVDAGVGSVEAAVGRIGVPSLGRGDWSVAYTAERFEVLLASLHERGADALWHIHADPAEVAVGHSCSGYLAFSTEIDSQPWVSFSVSAAYRAAVDGVVPGVGQQALLEFVADFAELSRASFANITDDNSASRTALETFLPRLKSDGLVESPEVLRGYSWVTVVPPKVVERLGGVGALDSSGAFVEVRPLRYGGVVVRATDRFEQYDDGAMARVFRALAPALPSGRPRQLPAYTGLTVPRLVYEDAADYQR